MQQGILSTELLERIETKWAKQFELLLWGLVGMLRGAYIHSCIMYPICPWVMEPKMNNGCAGTM